MIVSHSPVYTKTVTVSNSTATGLAMGFYQNGWQDHPMVTRIGRRKPVVLYIAEWRESRGLTQTQLADRLDTTDVTISRWETRKRYPDDRAKAALAHALDIEIADLYRHPEKPSADALLRGQPEEVIEQAMRLIQAIRR